jgi:methyl-accepting chemotaxis protein
MPTQPTDQSPPAVVQDTSSKQRRARIGLGAKVMVIVAGLVLALGLTTMWIVGARLQTVMRAEFHSKGSGIARALAHSAEQLLVEDNPAKLQTLVNEMATVEGVSYVVIAGADTSIVNHSFEGDAPAGLEEQLAKLADAENDEGTTPEAEIQVEGIGAVANISCPIVFGALGYAHVGMEAARIAAIIRGVRRGLLILFSVFLVVGLAVAFATSRILVRPIFNLTSVLASVSQGDLRVEARVNTRDELALLAQSVNTMIRSIREIVRGVRSASILVDGASNEILSSSQEQESGVVEQSASLEEIARTMTGLMDTATAIANNADELTSMAEAMSDDVHSGQGRLNDTRASMGEIVRHNELIADRIADLYEQSQSIISVIDIIDDISDRLDLLALNAALEGSRAGDLGKGFSLVAHEMRRLAENVGNSTKEIKKTVQEIHQYTEAATEASREGQAKTTEGAAEMETTVETMQTIFDLITKATDASRQIKVITQQQLSSTQQMVGAMKEASAVAQEGRVAAQETTRASSELAQISSDLREQVAVFSVDGERAAEPSPAAARAAAAEASAAEVNSGT